MKKFMVGGFLMMCALVMGCQSMLGQAPTRPEGAVACHSDVDCPSHSYCWFAGVDQYPSCRATSSENTF